MTIQVDSSSSRFSDNTSSNLVPSRFDTVRRVAGSTSLETRSRSSVPRSPCPARRRPASQAPHDTPRPRTYCCRKFPSRDPQRAGDEQGAYIPLASSGGSDEKLVSTWSALPIIRRVTRYELTCVSPSRFTRGRSPSAGENSRRLSVRRYERPPRESARRPGSSPDRRAPGVRLYLSRARPVPARHSARSARRRRDRLS